MPHRSIGEDIPSAAPVVTLTGAQFMNDHARQLHIITHQLRAQPTVRIADVTTNPLYSQWKHQGIYEIRDPADSQTIYIGKTKVARDGVAQRIWDHADKISGLLKTLQLTRKILRITEFAPSKYPTGACEDWLSTTLSRSSILRAT